MSQDIQKKGLQQANGRIKIKIMNTPFCFLEKYNKFLMNETAKFLFAYNIKNI